MCRLFSYVLLTLVPHSQQAIGDSESANYAQLAALLLVSVCSRFRSRLLTEEGCVGEQAAAGTPGLPGHHPAA